MPLFFSLTDHRGEESDIAQVEWKNDKKKLNKKMEFKYKFRRKSPKTQFHFGIEELSLEWANGEWKHALEGLKV